MDKHDTLLLSSGSAENRRLLRSILQERYNLLEALNTAQTLLLLRQNAQYIASLVIDISDAKSSDLERLRQEAPLSLLENIPVIFISEDDSSLTLTASSAMARRM